MRRQPSCQGIESQLACHEFEPSTSKDPPYASARDYRPISTSYHHQIFENGSLTIQDVTDEDAGYYLCQAVNGIGPGLSSVVTLSVNEAYRDCGFSFREIGSRVQRNQTTVMQICDRWMLEDTTDRRGRSHPRQCTTSREDRQIVRMAVTDLSATSRTVAQHIKSVTNDSVSARIIRRRLQQSGLSLRRPLLGLPLTQNHKHLRRQWCDERRMWAAEWNEVVFTRESRICLQHHDGLI
ncbi:transposable element Tcb1 transposase [Trichonephila clavipes]|uniref:Transposable element Tcb1 transposase n=1 Tax=Trichonephila clavipes TaxID=2585209 RepID=A0A8X7BGX7_TRICX|nr:transposable element Tcb1 transposase [Trichonephila clavipes]